MEVEHYSCKPRSRHTECLSKARSCGGIAFILVSFPKPGRRQRLAHTIPPALSWARTPF
jgi:hypothetical protein